MKKTLCTICTTVCLLMTYEIACSSAPVSSETIESSAKTADAVTPEIIQRIDEERKENAQKIRNLENEILAYDPYKAQMVLIEIFRSLNNPEYMRNSFWTLVQEFLEKDPKANRRLVCLLAMLEMMKGLPIAKDKLTIAHEDAILNRVEELTKIINEKFPLYL